MSNGKKRVAIFGAGVDGLTVAHELAKFPNAYEITVYEKHAVAGGLARSGRDAQGCATEYCWRVFFGFYKHLFEVLREIPTSEGTAWNTLVPKHYSEQRCSELVRLACSSISGMVRIDVL